MSLEFIPTVGGERLLLIDCIVGEKANGYLVTFDLHKGKMIFASLEIDLVNLQKHEWDFKIQVITRNELRG